MADEKNSLREVWVFNGPRNISRAPCFTSRALAEAWIEKHKLHGTLTAYPLDVSVYDWATELGYFRPKSEEQTRPEFIANFSSASQEHYHYDDDEG